MGYSKWRPVDCGRQRKVSLVPTGHIELFYHGLLRHTEDSDQLFSVVPRWTRENLVNEVPFGPRCSTPVSR